MTYLYLEDKEKNEIFFVHSRFTLFRNVWKRGTMGTMGRMGLQPLKSLQRRATRQFGKVDGGGEVNTLRIA